MLIIIKNDFLKIILRLKFDVKYKKKIIFGSI